MKHHLRFKHGKTEGEASSPLGMLLLATIAIVYRCAPFVAAWLGFFGIG